MFDFPFSFLEKSALLLIFFFHGMVFSFLALRQGIRNQSTSSKWLSLLLFLYAMYITPYMLGYANWYSGDITSDILFFIPFMQVLLIGPVFYFYTQSLLNRSFKFTKRDWLHLIPAGVYILYSLVVFVTDKFIMDEYYFYADGRDKDLKNWYQACGVISMSFYLVLSLRFYSTYKARIFDTVSFAESILFQWIRNFMLALGVILLLRVLFFITNPEWGNFGSQFWHYIAFSFVFYYISINGYFNEVKKGVLFHESKEDFDIFEPEVAIESKSAERAPVEDIEAWKEKLTRVLQDQKLYQNPRLTLSDVAESLGTNAKIISYIVNAGFGMNFNDFVNHYRIEAVKSQMDQGKHLQSTLLGIALDSGFNSKATFNRAFKKSTATSPKEYLEKLG